MKHVIRCGIKRKGQRWWVMGFLTPLLLNSSPLYPSTGVLFPLHDAGQDAFINYTKYGRFENRRTADYRYVLENEEGLAKAAGEGIYPNETSLEEDPHFIELFNSKRLEGPQGDFTPYLDPELGFFKWASLKGIPNKGLRLFNIAKSLELGGYPEHALKAYYAIVVHFPKEVCWLEGRPWYVGVSALDAVNRLLEEHPQWPVHLEGASITVENGFDRKGTNDVFRVDPGRWVPGAKVEEKAVEIGPAQRMIGQGNVRLVQGTSGHWQLIVDGEPFVIRGMCYSPTPVGRSPDLDGYKPYVDWMFLDLNNNSLVDGPHEAWLDVNRNNQKDRNEKNVGDFTLMKEMGVNTVRLYHHGDNKVLLRDMYNKYGITFLMGDLLGAYAIGSGAAWEAGTDYGNMDQQEKMRESVRRMVKMHKMEPYVLLWVLGNENNYGYGNNAVKNPLAFYKFANDIARMVHALDPDHPVALSNGDLENLDLIAQSCPDVDVLSVNVYRGSEGMGTSFWSSIKEVWKKPVLIGEFGCPAYHCRKGLIQGEKEQADYLLANWEDLADHIAGKGTGLCLGGVIFEWVDEWWKSGPQYEAWIQDKEHQSNGPFPDGHFHEEWMGVLSQGSGRHTPFMRQPRLVYYKFRNGPWKAGRKAYERHLSNRE
ncbi:MAG: hypothetical protein LHV69_03275 [Elusimicrobia bacterium]|nr:hypothetical protein [Candidatus Obscuribacterium magneticum]